MKTSEAAMLYANLGIKPPADIAAPGPEYVRGTRRKVVDGIEFRSTLEASTYQLLSLWRTAGLISGLECQPRYLVAPKITHYEGQRLKKCIRQITYRPDFRFERDGRQFVIESKGHWTEAARLRVKLFRAKYPQLVFEEWNRERLKEATRIGL